MSWFARSIANTLRLEDDVVSSPNHHHSTDQPTTQKQQTVDVDVDVDVDDSSPVSPSRGVKEDISELTKTLTRQFWGVASFLAPPPQSEPDKTLLDPDEEDSDPAGIAGLRSDIIEIGGRFKSGISKFSKNIPVSEITKMASNLLQLGEEEEEHPGRGAVGVTEEVVAFVRDIAMHPETWLDFPLLDDEDDEVDFDLSDAQQEHALAVESLAPRLAALRIELCPGYMSEARFWEIYFVLLHPRLEKQDAELLSTPQVVKARASLAQELHKRIKPIEKDLSKEKTFESTEGVGFQREMLAAPSAALSKDVVQDMSSVDVATSSIVADSVIDVHPVIDENQTVDKLVVGGPITRSKDEKLQSASASKLEDSDEEDADDWLKEENTEITGTSKTSMSFEDDEDVSFSDLEEDDSNMPTKSKKVVYSSDKDSQDWVQLKKSSPDLSRDTSSVNQIGSVKENVQNSDSKESNDWLDIDDLEVA
ncbi:hypothetical protein P3S68_018229 [Capsicum galapagoense]